MAFRDRIEVVVDFVTDPAKKGLTQLRADVAAADGVMGKAKVAATGLGQALSAYAAPAALAGAAAFTEFARRSVTAFQETALAAGQFADATGIAVDDASRWIAVGDDFGISAETIQGAFMRMNKAIAAGSFEKYGLEVKRAADGTVDANATFQAAVTTIGSISDATERARVAQEVFGRGYAGIARIMEMDAKSLRDALASVSDEQVIDAEESEKARELQASLDNLKDASERLMLAIGEGLVPTLADLAAGAADVAEPLLKLNETMNGTLFSSPLGGLLDLVDGTEELAQMVEEAKFAQDGWSARAEYAASRAAALAEEERKAAAAADVIASSMDAAAESADNLRQQQEELYDSVVAIADGKRAFEAAMDTYEQALADLGGTMLDTESSAEDVEDATRRAADAAIDAAKDYATMEGATLNSKEGQERLKESLGFLAGSLAPGSPLRRQLQDYIDDLNDIPTDVRTQVTVSYVGDGIVVDENGNLRLPMGNSVGSPRSFAPGGQPGSVSMPVAPVMPVMPEVGSDAWRAMADAAMAAGMSLEDYYQSLLDAYEEQARIFENQAELGLVDRDTYIKYLKDKQSALVAYSDEWMQYQREIMRLEEDAAREREAAEDEAEAKEEARREREKARRQAAKDDAREEAEALYELARARQALKDSNADFLKVMKDGEASKADVDAASESYARSIVAHLAARAAALGMKAYGVRWARFMRKRIEKQIAKQSEYPVLVKWLKIELKAIPDFEGIDDGEDGDDPDKGGRPTPGLPGQPAASSGVIAPIGGGGGSMLPTTGGVNITVNAGLGADGQLIGREVVKALRNYQLANGAVPIKVA